LELRGGGGSPKIAPAMEFAVRVENRLRFSADDSYESKPVRNRTMNIAYLWVALGGALGSVSRYWLNGLVSEKFTAAATFPLGTLLINISGSFLIGVFAALTVPEGRLDPQSRAFATQLVMVGLCGGYTTFSSFSLQTLNLLREREYLYAGGNVLFSVVFCLLAVWLGWMLGTIFNTAK
jgi:fluoride exporter